MTKHSPDRTIAYWAERAEKAERAVEDMRAEMRACDIHNGVILPEPRPLTAEDITDEMLTRAQAAYPGSDRPSLYRALIAALTEPPKRPEGAEELARLIAAADVGEWDCGDLADALLATGRVRVVPEDGAR